MSKQLAISAAFSIFTMAAFALFATPDGVGGFGSTQTGATAHAATPALEPVVPALFPIFG